MKERPVLFSGPMVRAIMAGKKTQTRRLMNFPGYGREFGESTTPGYSWTFRGKRTSCWNDVTHDELLQRCPYGEEGDAEDGGGDRLWVRETFALSVAEEICEERDTKDPSFWDSPIYKADAIEGGEWTDADGNPIPPPWRPSIHMPRWASRITLEVTGVRVERLQDISEDDAKAEGVDGLYVRTGPSTIVGRPWATEFALLWDTINGKRAPWASSPWVWVIEFRPLVQP